MSNKDEIIPQRVAANEETTILTPIGDHTSALDRIPVSRQKMWVILTSALGVALLATAGTAIYVGKVARDWESRAQELTTQNYDLGDKLAREQEQVISLQDKVDTSAEQVAALQQRMLALANDVNSRDDSVEYYAQEISTLTSIVGTASYVANELTRCIDAKTQYIGYLKNSSNYTASDLQQFEKDVNALCDTAVSANDDLQKVLTE